MKKPFLLLLVLLGGFLFGFSSPALAQRGGAAYNNCMIKPKFERPDFVRPTFDRAGFELPRPEHPQFVRSTIERTQVLHPSFEHALVIRPTFVTCKGDVSSDKVLRRRTLAAAGVPPADGTALARHGVLDRSPAPAQVAAVEDCCGGGASQPGK